MMMWCDARARSFRFSTFPVGSIPSSRKLITSLSRSSSLCSSASLVVAGMTSLTKSGAHFAVVGFKGDSCSSGFASLAHSHEVVVGSSVAAQMARHSVLGIFTAPYIPLSPDCASSFIGLPIGSSLGCAPFTSRAAHSAIGGGTERPKMSIAFVRPSGSCLQAFSGHPCIFPNSSTDRRLHWSMVPASPGLPLYVPGLGKYPLFGLTVLYGRAVEIIPGDEFDRG